jgi:hypothetical protein
VILRINSIALAGTSREASFEPGLNVILGPISTGKTALMRLLEVLLGGNYGGINPEVDRSVSELAGEITIGEGTYSVIRPLVQTDTARVQVAGDGVAERLPAMRPDVRAPLTYGVWLLERLDLPILRVPQAPTRPTESPFIPVSINDYIRYCRLRQDEIDVDVLGSSESFRDIKRRYVFRIFYGGYDVEVARLQDELRTLQSELSQLEGGRAAFDRFLEGTALENRADIQRQLAEAHERQTALVRARGELAAPEHATPKALQLRSEIAALEQRIADAAGEFEREQRSANQLSELANELQSQSARLTKAIVAGERFFDFEFVVCPRCGTTLGRGRGQEGHCYLCLQAEPPAPSREELIREQDRVSAQIAETEDLVRAHEQRARELEQSVTASEAERAELGRLLDEEVTSFVSDQAERLQSLARGMAAVSERIQRLQDYLALFQRLDEVLSRIAELQQRRTELEAALERAEQLDALTASRIERLEQWFAQCVDALEVPRFGTGIRAAIDRNDYQPVVNGQKFPQLSAGVRVLVNIAHLLAHHRAALELDLALPRLMMVDGIAKNIGTAGYDAARIEDIWTSLISLSDELGHEIQLIVAANDVPERVEPYVRLTLSAEERLIPTSDLR